ncbi:MAG TPA: PQQ-binding-like beta-propeller repeat protein [Gemmataceae bacterium]|jgi:outer membrane protein assembly factor BamB|nr:PQQ-binding-like beta-propeller repeat protein [Gemmataceae bacterium]
MVIRLALAFIMLSMSAVWANDWPQWRGPDRSGVSKETGLLKAWPKDGPKLLWTFKNAGEAFSSLAVVGDTVYTLGTRGPDEIVLALDVRDGTEVWSATIGTIFKAGGVGGDWGHGPRCTPTIDGNHLYALGSQGDLICLDIPSKGKKEVWRKNFQKDFGGEMMTEWGFSESPLVDGPHLLCTPGGDNGTMIALDKNDGRLVWQSKEIKNKAPYSSIMPAQINGVRQYIQNSFVDEPAGGVISSFSAKDGKVLWSMPIFKGDSYDIGPTPVVRDNLVYMTTYNTVSGCHCFEIDKASKATDLYSKKNQKVMKNNHGGVVLIGDHVYGYSDNLGWICQQFKSGDLVWNEKDKIICSYTGALVAAEGLLYLLTDEGEVGLVAADPKEFHELGSFNLPEKSTIPNTLVTSKKSKIWAHPVVANGRLYVRAHDLVFCYDIRAK